MDEIHRKLEDFRATRDIPKFTKYFLEDQKRFEGLLKCIYDLESYPFAEYGSWLLVHIIRGKKVDARALYNPLLDTLFKTENQTVMRNIAICLHEIGVQEYRETELIDLCLGFINDASNKVALQLFSIHLLGQFCAKYPELIGEVREVILINAEGKTPAYKVGMREFEKRFG